MKKIRPFQLGLLASLVACSSVSDRPAVTATPDPLEIERTVAAADTHLENIEAFDKEVAKLTEGIYQSYLLGQSYLEAFDELLDKDPEAAMKSDAYSSLLAIRTYVDDYEHDINLLHAGLTIIAFEQLSDVKAKDKAEKALGTLDQFYKGVRVDKSLVHENLRPLILTNLQENSEETYLSLLDYFKSHESKFVPEGKDKLHEKLQGLKTIAPSYATKLSTYKVSPDVLKAALKAERKKSSFKEFESEIKRQSKLMKEYISEVGRDTSSAGITPSTGPNGNISGKTFPKNTWSLTFDDGPGKTTDQLITNLVTRNVPATFFVLAKQVQAYPKTVSRLKNEGFDLASHSYTHAQLTKVGAAQLEREIGTAKKTIEAATGKTIKLFRLPYGAGVSVSHVRAKIAQHKMVHVFWTVDTLDWQDKNPNSILARSLKQMQASANYSGVVLFHDIHSQSVTASTMLMDYMNSKGLNICTVQGVVNQLNNDLSSCR